MILHLPAAVDDTAALSFGAALTDRALAFSPMREGRNHTRDWRLTWLVERAPDPDDIAALLRDAALEAGVTITADDWLIEKVADVNWLEHSYQQFQPFTVGDFYIYGSHYEEAPPTDKLPLQIDAATAFGSGEHGTTAGCLRALLRLKKQGFDPTHILDMGTGSGILAIAAARLWTSDILAVDIEEESVVVTARHAAMNGVGKAVTALHGDGFATPAVQEAQPWELVIANILAGPLIAMAPDLCAVTAKGGYIILSGMLNEQADDVAACYTALGCRLVESFVQDMWTAQLWRYD